VDNNIWGNDEGILVGSTSKPNLIKNNLIKDNNLGIYISSTSGITVIRNNITSSNVHGIRLYYGPNNRIMANDISNNNADGISVGAQSHSNKIIYNNLYSNNNDGISLRASNNNIKNNFIDSNTRYGIYVDSNTDNHIIGNTVSYNDYGIYLQSSSDNQIYHNNILNNTNQAYDDGSNIWNDNYPSGGNHWSDYSGIDLNSTPSQDVPPADGIGDTPYVIDFNSQDNYPLMDPVVNTTFLYNGWNLISIPYIQTETDMGAVLSSISGKYDAVQYYDVTDTNESWKHNHTSKPNHLNDLKNLNHTLGFWIHITELGGVIFEYPGIKLSTNQFLPLHPGWNLVGYPSLTNHNRTVGLNNLEFGTDVDAIQWFDASTKTWHFMGPDDPFVPGRGYWVHSKVEAGWEVPL
jgi:parallel beta-helix repeat protein